MTHPSPLTKLGISVIWNFQCLHWHDLLTYDASANKYRNKCFIWHEFYYLF